MMDISHLDHLVLTVKDIPATVRFYQDVLGMTAITFGEGRTALVFGQQKINLHQAGEEFEPKAAQVQPGSADLCFIAATPLETVMMHFDKLGVAIEEGPVKRTGATAPLISLYLRDPDGNLIEVSNTL